MIGPWLETQPKGIRDLLDPSMGPAEATRRLFLTLSRGEDLIECIRSLDAFFSKRVSRLEKLVDSLDAVCKGHIDLTQEAKNRVARLEADLAGYRLSIARALGMTYQAEGHAEHPCADELAVASIEELRKSLATARAAMGPLGTPPLPGAETVAPNGQVMVGIPKEHQPPENYTEIQFPLPNDPRLP